MIVVMISRRRRQIRQSNMHERSHKQKTIGTGHQHQQGHSQDVARSTNAYDATSCSTSTFVRVAGAGSSSGTSRTTRTTTAGSRMIETRTARMTRTEAKLHVMGCHKKPVIQLARARNKVSQEDQVALVPSVRIKGGHATRRARSSLGQKIIA